MFGSCALDISALLPYTCSARYSLRAVLSGLVALTSAAQQQEVLDLIRQARADGATVFFCSHIMSEVQATADRVAMIRTGEIVEVAEPRSLIDRALRRITIHFQEPVDSRALADLPGVKVLSRDDNTSITLQVEGDMDGLVKALGAFPISYLETARLSLEEVFLAHYRTN